MLSSAAKSQSPKSMLRIYLCVVVVTALVAICSVLYTSSEVDEGSQTATEQAESAVLAAEIQTDVRAPLGLLFANAYAFMSTDTSLPPQARQALLAEIMANLNTPNPVISAKFPGVVIPMSEKDTFTLQRDMDMISRKVEALSGRSAGVDLGAVMLELAQSKSAMDGYVETKSADSFRQMFASTVALGARLGDAGDGYAFSLRLTEASLGEATRIARFTMVGALMALTVTMGVATLYVSRIIQNAFASGEAERAELRETTSSLKYRNDQLNALYNVFAEITDTLSMRYVINATLRETLRVMNASMVTLRLVRGSQLVMAGNLTADGREVADIPPVPLGEGPTGRVARRGRSMRINSNAQSLLGPSIDPDHPNSGVNSGIIVPLIVGARVVGTLACWSDKDDAFAEEDERILEMMASQVATAVLAADTTETSERRALQDPLTGLPNRRQLNEDIAGQLAMWPENGRRAVVAMVDVDHFKRLNDDFGHRVGDVTLQKVASVMRLSLRDADRIYRYGGEEFVVIFADVGRSEATVLADRMLKAVAETPLSGDQLEPVGPVTITAGLSLMPEHGVDFAGLIELADRAMYRAKEAGRNRIMVWDDSLITSQTAA
jgi:diguanylate cyclase (GGDEF)-like protein